MTDAEGPRAASDLFAGSELFAERAGLTVLLGRGHRASRRLAVRRATAGRSELGARTRTGAATPAPAGAG